MNLVEKGRTMSIDQALREGAPRTLSVDSVDYTNMVGCYLDEPTMQALRKHRKHHRKNGNKYHCLFGEASDDESVFRILRELEPCKDHALHLTD